MLGKLIKYDLKALNHFLIPVHVFLLLFALLGRFLLTSRIELTTYSDTFDTNSLLLTMSILLFSLIFAGASFATYIIIAVRFYKNIYSDEGYLSHTLPVTRGQHLLAKTVSGSIWALIDMILLIGSLLLVIITPSVTSAFHDNKEHLLRELGISDVPELNTFFAILFLLMVVGVIAGVVTEYASITCGQLFSGHRVLGAIVSYFAFQTGISVITILIMTLCGYFNATINYNTNESFSHFIDIMTDTLLFSGILSLIILVVFYVLTQLLMNKKLNLQ